MWRRSRQERGFDVSLAIHQLDAIPTNNSQLHCQWSLPKALSRPSAGSTGPVPVTAHVARWAHVEHFAVRIPSRKNHYTELDPCVLTVRVFAADNQSIGAVEIDLSEYAGAGQTTSNVLLQDSLLNSVLSVTICLRQTSGDLIFRRTNYTSEDPVADHGPLSPTHTSHQNLSPVQTATAPNSPGLLGLSGLPDEPPRSRGRDSASLDGPQSFDSQSILPEHERSTPLHSPDGTAQKQQEQPKESTSVQRALDRVPQHSPEFIDATFYQKVFRPEMPAAVRESRVDAESAIAEIFASTGCVPGSLERELPNNSTRGDSLSTPAADKGHQTLASSANGAPELTRLYRPARDENAVRPVTTSAKWTGTNRLSRQTGHERPWRRASNISHPVDLDLRALQERTRLEGDGSVRHLAHASDTAVDLVLPRQPGDDARQETLANRSST